MRIMLIAVGGGVGSILRYILGAFAQHLTESLTARLFGYAVPVGTFAVNMIGCLAIGVLAALFAKHYIPHEQYRLALTVGLLGGFTTFSAFGLDTFSLIQRGHWAIAMFNVIGSCVIGIAAVALGYYATDYLAGQ